MIARVFAGGSEGLTRDDVLDNITLTWLTNTALRRPSILGEQGGVVLRRQGRRGTGTCKRLPRRTLSCSTELGGAGLPQAHSLQQAAQGWALCGLGTAEALFREQFARASDRCGRVLPIDVGDAPCLEAGDVLTVTRLDRLARSTRDLLNMLATITDKQAGFRSLGDTWADTTTSHGRLMLTVFGGLAEFDGIASVHAQATAASVPERAA